MNNLSDFKSLVSVIAIMSTPCSLRNTLSSLNLPRIPFAFQVIVFKNFSLGVNYVDILLETSIIIWICANGSPQFFSLTVSNNFVKLTYFRHNYYQIVVASFVLILRGYGLGRFQF
jgi:hypothetical protein